MYELTEKLDEALKGMGKLTRLLYFLFESFWQLCILIKITFLENLSQHKSTYESEGFAKRGIYMIIYGMEWVIFIMIC